MSITVIVVSYNAILSLRACLESLTRQPAATEIIVSDCSAEDPAIELGPLFPQVRFLYFAEKRTVPQLRWAALAASGPDIVASTEARCVPGPDWASTIERVHHEWPGAPAVGGQVSIAQPADAMDFGLFLCEYGPFAAPVPIGPAANLTGANISFKRSCCEQLRPLLDAGHWETVLMDQWVLEGKPLILSNAQVTFWNSMSLATILRQRFTYGRGYAAVRTESSGRTRRFLFALFCPLLPLLLCARLARLAVQRRFLTAFLRAFLWIFVFQIAWSAGEFTGYAWGASRKNEIF